MKRAVVELHSRTPTTFLLLSNSNSVFISTILEHHSLSNVFAEVITNPAEWQGDLISLRRRVDPHGPQHGCKVGCSANMCKGAELDAFLERHGGRDAFARIVYVGDGANDFCPVLRLNQSALALLFVIQAQAADGAAVAATRSSRGPAALSSSSSPSKGRRPG